MKGEQTRTQEGTFSGESPSKASLKCSEGEKENIHTAPLLCSPSSVISLARQPGDSTQLSFSFLSPEIGLPLSCGDAAAFITAWLVISKP